MNAPPNSTGFAGVSREEALRRAADLSARIIQGDEAQSRLKARFDAAKASR